MWLETQSEMMNGTTWEAGNRKRKAESMSNVRMELIRFYNR